METAIEYNQREGKRAHITLPYLVEDGLIKATMDEE
jgi:hypothetical protein